MQSLRAFFRGFFSVMTVSTPPLYRYPYRNSAEAFRGDWKRIGGDIHTVFDKEVIIRDEQYD